MKIAVVGLGKIGLPLAVQYASKGHDVYGVDADEGVVELVNAGRVPFPGEAHLAELLESLSRTGAIVAETSYQKVIPGVDVVVVVVPLFSTSNGEPDFRIMDSATESIAKNLTRNTLVLYETTLPVGTTRQRWAPMLEKISGLTQGEDFFVAFSPERVLTGRVFEDLKKYPKIVGALCEEGAQLAENFYQQVLDFDDRPDLVRPNGVWMVPSAEAAEFVKLAETTYRDVNIGLANQFAIHADSIGVDIYEVIEAANSQPFSHIHQPGIAVGGHCIPIYPRLYLWNDPDATIVSAARQANLEMPGYSVGLLEKELETLEGVRVLILGASYRGGVKETAFSGVFDVYRELLARGASPTVLDPMFSADELGALGLAPHLEGDDVDAIIVQSNHAEFRALDSKDFPGVKVVVDGRNWLQAGSFPKIISVGKTLQAKSQR